MENLEIKTRALSSLMKDIKKGLFNFNHPLQRQSGQWNKEMMGNLVDSIIRMYPIYPALVDKNDNGIYGVIDGKQRLTILYSYFNNEFALPKNLDPVSIDGQLYDLAGKKYDKLNEVVKDRFDSREFQLYIMKNATDNDIREIFARINSSKGLSNTQKRTTIESDELANLVFELKSHPFFDKVISKNQKKKDVDKDIVRQILMLIENGKTYQLNSFKTKDIDAFIESYNKNIDMARVNILKSALDKLNDSFDEIKLNLLTIPMAVYGMYWCLSQKKSTTAYIEWLKKFIETYDSNDEYKKYCLSGSASKENVTGRLTYFKDALKSLK